MKANDIFSIVAIATGVLLIQDGAYLIGALAVAVGFGTESKE